MNRHNWEEKYSIVPLLKIVHIPVSPDVRKKLKLHAVKMEAPNYSMAIDFLIDYHIEGEKEKEAET